jgi:geranylgeranyl pyrophosphate synthase
MEECSILLASFPAAQKTIFAMLNEVVCGQIVDVHFSHEDQRRTLEEITHKDNLKSGQYSLAKPLLVGVVL